MHCLYKSWRNFAVGMDYFDFHSVRKSNHNPHVPCRQSLRPLLLHARHFKNAMHTFPAVLVLSFTLNESLRLFALNYVKRLTAIAYLIQRETQKNFFAILLKFVIIMIGFHISLNHNYIAFQGLCPNKIIFI